MEKTVLVVTDAWHPQVNGVVRTLDELARSLKEQGIAIHFLTPERFATFPLPFYSDIRLALPTMRQVA